jgi:hypothetical protein
MNVRTVAFATTIAALLVAPGVTWAQASTEPVAGMLHDVDIVDPGTSFVDEDGILHIRNQITEQVVDGGLMGSQVVTISVNINPATGSGDIHGSYELSARAVELGLTGSFEGRFDGMIVGGVSFFSVTGPRGSGGFDGMKMMVTGQGVGPGVSIYSGQILSPHGF